MASLTKEVSTAQASPEAERPTTAQGDLNHSINAVSSKLHSETFATPGDFLATLKQDYERLPKSYPGALQIADLDNIVQTSSDKHERALALVTATHFVDLQKLAATSHSGDKGYLTADDIQSALNLQSDNLDEYKGVLEKKQVTHTLEAVGGATALTTAAILSSEAPLVSGFFAVSALALSAIEVSNFYALQNRIDNAKTASSDIKTSMSNWKEINGGK